MLKVIETDKRSDFVDLKGKIYGDLTSNKSDNLFSKYAIPKIAASNFLGTKTDHSDGNFLTWSSVTSAAPSPPVENTGFVKKIVPEQIHSDPRSSKDVPIDLDFTKGVSQRFSPDDLHMFERFKESIELLIVKVSFNILNLAVF